MRPVEERNAISDRSSKGAPPYAQVLHPRKNTEFIEKNGRVVGEVGLEPTKA